MKKSNNYLFIIVTVIFTMIGLNANQDYCRAEETIDGEIIRIRQLPNSQTDAPRSETTSPFFAELLDMGVLLFADTDWGDVGVTLSSIEGDYYYTVFDTSDGAIVLPTNGDIGDSYTITIVTSGNLIFEGEFYL